MTAPTIHAVHAIGRVSLNPMTHGATMNATPMRAVSPSRGIMSGRTSSATAATAAMAPRTIIVVVARVVVVVQMGDNAA